MKRFAIIRTSLTTPFIAGVLLLTGVPTLVHADSTGPELSAVSISSNNLNTSLAHSGDRVTLTFIASEPLTAPVVTLLNHSTADGSVQLHSFDEGLYTATYTIHAADAEGIVPFSISYPDDAGDATTTISSLIGSSSNVTIDTEHPTLQSVGWQDADASTELSGGDTLVFTWSEPILQSTIDPATLDTELGLSNGHTFGVPGVASTSMQTSWNAAGTVLTVTLGQDSTVTANDTVQPRTQITDLVGNSAATPAALPILDTLPPHAPIITPGSSNFFESLQVSLSDALPISSSTQIYYTLDGTTPTCSSTAYATSFTVVTTQSVEAVACDESGNMSPVSVATFTHELQGSSGGGGGGGGGGTVSSGASQSTNTAAVNPQTSAVPVASVATAAQPQAAPGLVLGASTYNFLKTLARGSTGADVTALQTFLQQEGLFSAKVTGYFGPATEASVKAYQTQNGLEAIGIVGPKTRALLARGLLSTTPIAANSTPSVSSLMTELATLQAELAKLTGK